MPCPSERYRNDPLGVLFEPKISLCLPLKLRAKMPACFAMLAPGVFMQNRHYRAMESDRQPVQLFDQTESLVCIIWINAQIGHAIENGTADTAMIDHGPFQLGDEGSAALGRRNVSQPVRTKPCRRFGKFNTAYSNCDKGVMVRRALFGIKMDNGTLIRV